MYGRQLPLTVYSLNLVRSAELCRGYSTDRNGNKVIILQLQMFIALISLSLFCRGYSTDRNVNKVIILQLCGVLFDM